MKSLVVPVLPARSLRWSALRDLAAVPEMVTSRNMESISQALRGLSTRGAVSPATTGVVRASTLPSASLISLMM